MNGPRADRNVVETIVLPCEIHSSFGPRLADYLERFVELLTRRRLVDAITPKLERLVAAPDSEIHAPVAQVVEERVVLSDA